MLAPTQWAAWEAFIRENPQHLEQQFNPVSLHFLKME